MFIGAIVIMDKQEQYWLGYRWNIDALFQRCFVCYQEPQSGMETVSHGMRADPWYGTIFLFLEQIAPSWRHISALIHARVVGSRVDVVTLCDEMVRVARFSCRFFTGMAGNKASWQRRRTRALLSTFMPWFNGKGVFFRVENFLNFLLWMNKIRSPASYTHKLLFVL